MRVKTKPNNLQQSDNFFITVDPGVNIGIALFNNKTNIPIKTYLVEPPSGKIIVWENDFYPILWNFQQKLEYIITDTDYRPLVMHIEKPRFMESSKGMVSARSDAFVKLVSIYGACCYIARSIGYQVKPLEIMKWKGNLDKVQVINRIKKAINKDYGNHVADAVGMGLYLKGLL